MWFFHHNKHLSFLSFFKNMGYHEVEFRTLLNAIQAAHMFHDITNSTTQLN